MSGLSFLYKQPFRWGQWCSGKSQRLCLASGGLNELDVPFLEDNHGGGPQLAGTFPGFPEAVKGYKLICGHHWEFNYHLGEGQH